mmetsp:Transcript_76614/g.153804  ORF Transcript_76614/g.153804 Transcript_76614/m.153804 type:complete len:221 (-) Transcript_76614:221-883(-)|eukprot:CAMPEP_0171720824 /NCGR_PEP_ID=MMETSP0991-20121206/22007_1 /TAXON_ID=483369 /ORGANISM="non described non described, Strain CCMP2098" /LENGTH=220 /DNA_ID=CAMNT_0012312603 /DNA_START=704 /DNA_END=1366 /DNA_ORIENTATION=-
MASLEATLQTKPLTREEKQLGRRLTQLLRHGKPRRLPFRQDGFVQLTAVRTVPGFDSLDHTLAQAIVAEDNKQRFSLHMEQAGDWWIRANQGHTIKGLDDEQLLTRVTDASQIPMIVHGTYFTAWPHIRTNGLSRMKRNHVHFASGLPEDSGVISGMRTSAQVLVYINGAKAMAHGVQFFTSTNGVILSPGLGTNGIVAPELFSQVVDAQTGRVLFSETK